MKKQPTPPPPDPLDLTGIYLTKPGARQPNAHCLLIPDSDTSVAILNALTDYKTPYENLTGKQYLAKHSTGLQLHFVRSDNLAAMLRLIRHWQPVSESIRINTGTIDRF